MENVDCSLVRSGARVCVGAMWQSEAPLSPGADPGTRSSGGWAVVGRRLQPRHAVCAEACNVGSEATDLQDDLAHTFQTFIVPDQQMSTRYTIGG